MTLRFDRAGSVDVSVTVQESKPGAASAPMHMH
jgi:hypothetical protein